MKWILVTFGYGMGLLWVWFNGWKAALIWFAVAVIISLLSIAYEFGKNKGKEERSDGIK